MTLNASLVRIAGTGELSLATPGTLEPTPYIYKSQEFTVKPVFQETKAAVLSAYVGGSPSLRPRPARTFTVPSSPRSGVATWRALCVDWVDQVSDVEIYHHRLYLPRAEASDTDDAQWSRSQENLWGMTFSALWPAGATTTLAVWLTDDPAVLITPPRPAVVRDRPVRRRHPPRVARGARDAYFLAALSRPLGERG